MTGRRLADFFDDRPEFNWSEVQPGDYWKQRDGRFYLQAPSGADFGSIDQRWTIIEHEDRTITVSPSIWFNPSQGWHGYLERGIWRSV